MKATFPYYYTEQPVDELVVPNIGDCAILANDDFGNQYVLIIRTVLGVTGFLGIHILYELLTTTSSTIYCIIREKDNLNAIQRFHNKFEFYFGKEIFRKYEDRIIPITGNLLKDNLGLYDTYCFLTFILLYFPFY